MKESERKRKRGNSEEKEEGKKGGGEGMVGGKRKKQAGMVGRKSHQGQRERREMEGGRKKWKKPEKEQAISKIIY